MDKAPLKDFLVPMQPYAGRNIVVPIPDERIGSDEAEELDEKSNDKPEEKAKKLRHSFFQRSAIRTLLRTSCEPESKQEFPDDVVETILCALETYMEHILKKMIKICEHRCGYQKYNGNYFTMKNEMRPTFSFLTNMDLDEYYTSDDEFVYSRKQRRISRMACNNFMRMVSANSTALMAIGDRKQLQSEYGNPEGNVSSSQLCQNESTFKRVNVKDVLFFMRQTKRYAKSKMLCNAYINC